MHRKKYLTDHEPKMIRRYDGTHVNIASFVNRFRLSRKVDMAKAELRRHVCELDARMKKQVYLQQDGMFMKLTMERASS